MPEFAVIIDAHLKEDEEREQLIDRLNDSIEEAIHHGLRSLLQRSSLRVSVCDGTDTRRDASEAARRAFAELLIDCEEDRTLRAVLVGMLREGDRLHQADR
jgi:hypothetical protein